MELHSLCNSIILTCSFANILNLVSKFNKSLALLYLLTLSTILNSFCSYKCLILNTKKSTNLVCKKRKEKKKIRVFTQYKSKITKTIIYSSKSEINKLNKFFLAILRKILKICIILYLKSNLILFSLKFLEKADKLEKTLVYLTRINIQMLL